MAIDRTGAATVDVPGEVVQYGGSGVPAGWLLCDGSAVSRTTYADLFNVISTTYGTGDGSTTFNLPDMRSRMPMGAGTGTFTATISSVNTTSEELTITSNNSIYTGTAVLYSTTGTAIGGLTNNTTYYGIRMSATVVKLATSRANAVASTAINLTSAGSGTQTLGITYTARSRGDVGGEETHAITSTEMPSHTHGIYTYSHQNWRFNYYSAWQNEFNFSLGSGQSVSTGSSTDETTMQPFATFNYIIKT